MSLKKKKKKNQLTNLPTHFLNCGSENNNQSIFSYGMALYIYFQSVTAFGRMMIEQTKCYVEEKYTVANGYDHNAKVCKIFI